MIDRVGTLFCYTRPIGLDRQQLRISNLAGVQDKPHQDLLDLITVHADTAVATDIEGSCEQEQSYQVVSPSCTIAQRA